MGAVVLAMFAARRTALRELDTPEARAQWQQWRESEPNTSDTGPVERRPPKSTEPPELVLLRDYFGVMLSAAVVFGSLLFGAVMFLARGALSSGGAPAASEATSNNTPTAQKSDSLSPGGRGSG